MDGKIVATGITFDDVLLLPRFSTVVPADVDVGTLLTRGIRLNIPIVSSPMDTVTESEMAIALAQEGGLGVIHKNLPVDRQAEEVDKVKRSANGIITIKDIDMMKRFPNACKDRQGRLRVGGAVGVFDFERAASLIAKGVDMLVVDSAHGHSANVIETVATIKKRWNIEVVAGNVATREGCRDLIAAGVDGSRPAPMGRSRSTPRCRWCGTRGSAAARRCRAGRRGAGRGRPRWRSAPGPA